MSQSVSRARLRSFNDFPDIEAVTEYMRTASTSQDGETSLMKQTYILSLVIGASLGLGACASRTDTGASQPASTPTSSASTAGSSSSSPGSSADTTGSTANTTRSSSNTPGSSASSSSTAAQTGSTRNTQSSTASTQRSAGTSSSTPRSTQTDANSADRSTTDATSLTGCLMKGDGADSYVLVEEATGNKTTVTGTAELAKHAMNHRVTLTGARSSGGTFTVTKIQHLAANCQAKQQ